MSIDVIAEAAAGPFAAACLLLAYAGASKVRRPLDLQPSASALGLPATPASIRMLGIAEAGVAVTGLAVGGVAAGVVAVVYGSLAVAAWRLLARSPGTPCGCLGASPAPVTTTHVVVNVAAALAAGCSAAHGSPLGVAESGVWSRGSFAVLVVCGACLAASLLDGLPALGSPAREGGSR